MSGIMNLGIKEAAKILNVSRNTLDRWIKKYKDGDQRYKGLPFHQLAHGHQYSFNATSLLEWYRNRPSATPAMIAETTTKGANNG